MRPVERGVTDEKFKEYQDAKGLLLDRLGQYCSYCERHFPGGLAVEHIQPKDSNPDLELEWSNFLLSCINCNSTKKDKTIVLDDYFWVDQHNTLLAFEYKPGGIIVVNPNLNEEQQRRAKRTLELFGLEKRPSRTGQARDLRWSNRILAWDLAQEERQELQNFDTPLRRNSTVKLAVSRGYWSVWMTVFKDDSDMLERFIKAFPGTANCFEPTTFQPVPRVGGLI